MRLYEVILFTNYNTWPDYTRYFTNRAKAKRFMNKHKNDFQAKLSECEIPDRLTVEQWIDLLESDAPGNQDFKLAITELKTYI